MAGERKFEYLPKLIKQTRAARIVAERRLLALDALSKHATVYYACLSTACALTAYFYPHKALELLSAVLAVCVALCTAYAGSQNYGMRAERMKGCYTDLQKLWLEFDNSTLPDEISENKFADEAGVRYLAIVKQTENHTTEDHERATHGHTDIEHGYKYVGVRLCVYGAPIVAGALVLFLGRLA